MKTRKDFCTIEEYKAYMEGKLDGLSEAEEILKRIK